ncbi:ABC transporter ATP-binding protein [Nioella ostreopsis]|uniref:ABC transporter ATP-binding protein n=1 Tax=Nioella ostreopsis TaxID=2448479 RepID=UPI000FDC6A19|nr:ABC transporter ATP-binding protein [Nioella ostreopsis]
MMNRLANLIDAFRPADGPPPNRLLAFFNWCLKGAWPVLIGAALVSGLAGLFEVGSAVVLGLVVDAASTADPATMIQTHWHILLAGIAFFLILRPLAFAASSAASTLVVGPAVNVLVLQRLNRHTLGQSVTFFDDDFAGRIAQKQMQTASAVTNVVTEFVNVVAFALASLIGSLLLLVTIDARMALALFVWLIAYFTTISFFLPRVRTLSKSRAGARAAVSGQVVDTITNIKTVKLFAHHAFEDRSALNAMEKFRQKAIGFGRISASFRLALMTVAGALPVILIGGTVWLWTHGIASTGDIAATGAVSIRIAQMTGWVSFVLMAIYSNVGEVEDGMNTLSPAHTLTDRDNALEVERAKGHIRFDDVSFAYGRQTGGVTGLSLDVRPGEKLGIVGASGAGKSTLVALLLRLYDAEEGRVLLDECDVRDLTQESLRRQIAMVTQETAMFNRSARDNILYGRPGATEEEMVDAAKRAEAHEFILGLQDHMGRKGYDAYLGERGVKLSGGQRQRIALARAFLKNAPVLVLDEATSALDSEVEAAIQDTLGEVMEGKTVIAIAHRLSTIAQMDRIIVLDEGRVVEEGSHDALLDAGGLYARYWNRQSGGFIGIQEAAE